MYEESGIVADMPAVVPFVVPVSISEETATDMDVCDKPRIDAGSPVVANLYSSQTAHGKSLCPLNPLFCR